MGIRRARDEQGNVIRKPALGHCQSVIKCSNPARWNVKTLAGRTLKVCTGCKDDYLPA